MTYFTSNTYQLKREILNFSENFPIRYQNLKESSLLT